MTCSRNHHRSSLSSSLSLRGRSLVRGLAGLAVISALSGWTRPESPTSVPYVKDRADRLDYVLVTVNGKPRMVKAGDELAVVRGDKLQVKEAALYGRGAIREVNVIGYQRAGTNDDRGATFSTKDLVARWSEGEGGAVYAVAAAGRKLLHGVVYLRVIEPVLRYAEVSINGKKRVLRDGEPLRASAKDLVKVERVETNLEAAGDVVFQIVPAASDGAASKDAGRPGLYEIRFLRGEQAFARIPLTLEGG